VGGEQYTMPSSEVNGGHPRFSLLDIPVLLW